MESCPSSNLVWWPTPVVSIPGNWKQKDQELKVSLSHMVSSRPTWIHKTLSQTTATKDVRYERGAGEMASLGRMLAVQAWRPGFISPHLCKSQA